MPIYKLFTKWVTAPHVTWNEYLQKGSRKGLRQGQSWGRHVIDAVNICDRNWHLAFGTWADDQVVPLMTYLMKSLVNKQLDRGGLCLINILNWLLLKYKMGARLHWPHSPICSSLVTTNLEVSSRCELKLCIVTAFCTIIVHINRKHEKR